MCRNNIKKYSVSFDWDHKNVIYGEKFRYCNDSLCDGLTGCGCPDADMYQVIKIWNNHTLKYDIHYEIINE